MRATRAIYINRSAEIDKYFDFLQKLDIGNNQLVVSGIDGINQIHEIDGDLFRILKANGFLLLYNLMEALIRQAIGELFEKIGANNLTYSRITDLLKKIWIKEFTFNHRNSYSSMDYNKIHIALENVANHIIRNEIVQLKKECFKISGNIDDVKIREIAQTIGFTAPANGNSMATIKLKRNHLAHGNFSFSEIGQNYSVNELNGFKVSVFAYLEQLINNISDYVDGQRFVS